MDIGLIPSSLSFYIFLFLFISLSLYFSSFYLSLPLLLSFFLSSSVALLLSHFILFPSPYSGPLLCILAFSLYSFLLFLHFFGLLCSTSIFNPLFILFLSFPSLYVSLIHVISRRLSRKKFDSTTLLSLQLYNNCFLVNNINLTRNTEESKSQQKNSPMSMFSALLLENSL